MNPSALDNSISSLQNEISRLEVRADSLDLLLVVATLVVAVGVALEIFVVYKEHLDARRAWSRGSIRSPEKPLIWFFIFQLFGTVLITAGVVGELWASVLAIRINGELRSKNRELVALVNRKAGEASERAANAEGSANKTEQENLKLKIALETLRLREGPRFISERDRQYIVSTLKRYSGTIQMREIWGNALDHEPRDYAQRIFSIMQSTGSWKVKFQEGSGTPNNYGLQFHVATKPSAGITRLICVFHKIGSDMTVSGEPGFPFGTGAVNLYVGYRRPLWISKTPSPLPKFIVCGN